MRIRTPFLGGAYQARSVNLNNQRLVNLFPEMVDTKDGKEIAAFYGTPGKVLWQTIGTGPIYGQRVVGNFLYVVSGNTLYKVTTSGSATSLGTINVPSNVCVMKDNGTQLLIVSDPTGYVYDTVAGTLNTLTSPFPSCQSVAYQDGYFLSVSKGTQLFYVSNINDGSTWNALNFGSCTEVGDNLLAVLSTRGVLWLFGSLSIEFWYNSGDTLPFTKIPNATTKTGLTAIYSLALCNDTPYFLGQSEEGVGIVYKGVGYGCQRVSTHAIEKAIQGYSVISDAVGFSYQQEGHWFYSLSFPTANATWVYDESTGFWHERTWFNQPQNTDDRDRAWNSSYFNGMTLVGDWQNGNIYQLSLDSYTDNGVPMKWLRSWNAMPTGKNSLANKVFNILQIDCDVGVGLQSGQGSNPQAMLRWSDDGGNTWSSGVWKTMGAVGQYQTWVRFKRLGSAVNRVFELSGTDPVKRYLAAAHLDYDES